MRRDGGSKGRARASARTARPGRSPAIRFAILLRGVNVGARNALPMADLRALLGDVGCTGVRTLLQSGNAVVETRLGERELTRAVEAAVSERMGRHVAVTARTARELRAILEANPLGAVASDPARSCVTFLSAAPSVAEVAPVVGRGWGPEMVRVAGREIHAWHPDGQARSPLAEAIARLPLGGTVTTRNWNTVVKLAAMLDDPNPPGDGKKAGERPGRSLPGKR